MIIQVSPSLNIFETLSYHYTGDPALLKPGLRVVIPLANRITTGWVTDTHSHYKGKVKDILGVVKDGYLPDKHFLAFVKAVSGIYFTSMGMLLDAALSPSQKPITSLYFENKEKQGKIEKLSHYSIDELQRLSTDGAIETFYKSRDAGPAVSCCPGTGSEFTAGVNRHNFAHETPENRFLIGYHRETRYREIIHDCLNHGKSVLITVPDNLTAAYLAEKLEQGAMNASIDLYNSEVKPKDRETLWRDYVLANKTGVVVGGQSAVLLPIANLGAVICERSGSAAYSRTYFSKYNIRLLSELRAFHYNVSLMEGFSTHTVRSFHSRSQIFIEDQREEKIQAEVRMVRGGSRGIPADFVQLLNNYFLENKKVLVVLNKKESFNFLYCGKCKKVLRCPSCDRAIEVDGDSNIKCLHCAQEETAFTTCNRCGEPLALVEDISVASLKKALKQQVVETGIMTLSAEGLKDEHMYSLMKRIEDSKIIISTPVILNPLFNNRFDAVIYMRPESYFNIEEYDAAEKIFSMAAELRELVKKGGSLDIFSTFHFHYSLKLINDEEGFFGRELKYREWFHLPPFVNVYHIEIKDKSLRKLGKEMRKIYTKFKDSLTIKRIYLKDRQAIRGLYKGVIEAHTQPEAILESELLGNRNISIDLVMI
jgi:primosomal protein N'